ncbi:MAG: hypothetical protein MRY79_01850 [Alphaproteobacteria bacterium]|nr:hypothetical protein [Alphaproteobacteria bacterium]
MTVELAIVTSSRKDFISFVQDLVEAIDISLFDEIPLDVSVNGTRGSGKSIIPEAFSEGFLGHYYTDDYESLVFHNEQGDDREAGFYTVSSVHRDFAEKYPDRQIIHADLMDGEDEYLPDLLRIFPYPQIVSKQPFVDHMRKKIRDISSVRPKGGINFWQNAEIPGLAYGVLSNSLNDFCGMQIYVGAKNTEGSDAPYGRISEWELYRTGLKGVFYEARKRPQESSETNEWARVVRMKVSDQRLLSDPTFQRFICDKKISKLYQPAEGASGKERKPLLDW